MGLIGLEQPELFALELKKLLYLTLLTLEHLQISTNRHQICKIIHDHKISDQFDYGSNQIRLEFFPLN